MDEGYYLREARRCQELAATAPDSKTARRWHKLADDYTVLAEVLDAHIHHRPPTLRMPQQAQQQQSKARRPLS
jgi:hypothetical protein